jgi:putative membrane protein
MADGTRSGPSDYLAAERTFLAWIRTGLALMGFGFVVARFGLFLQALQVGSPHLELRPYGPSFWFGTALIVLGVIVNILSAWSHFRLVQELARGGTDFNRPSWLAMGVALILAVVGLAMAIYLFSVHEPGQENLEERRERSMTAKPENGIALVPSQHSVDQTVGKLEEILPGWNSPHEPFAQRGA